MGTMASDPSYSFCDVGLDSDEHMFFGCSFLPGFGPPFWQRMGFEGWVFGLADEVTWAGLHGGGNTLQHIVFKYSFAACIYHIRREWNTRIENGVRTLISSCSL